MRHPNAAPQSAGLVFSWRTSYGRIEIRSSKITVRLRKPRQFNQFVTPLSLVALCHPSLRKQVGPGTSVTGNPTRRTSTPPKWVPVPRVTGNANRRSLSAEKIFRGHCSRQESSKVPRQGRGRCELLFHRMFHDISKTFEPIQMLGRYLLRWLDENQVRI